MKTEYIQTLLRHDTAWIGHGLFAMRLVEEFRPSVIVDLGVDYGFSSFCFAYPKIGIVYGIDWFQGDEHTGSRNTLGHVINLYDDLMHAFGITNVEFIKGDFADVAGSWDKPIDILHIDGLHTYAAVKSDYENWSKFCNDDSIILFHDVESFPDTVGKFFMECNGHKLVKQGSAGLGILTRSEDRYERIKGLIADPT